MGVMKASVSLEFGNQKHRDQFLKDMRALMVRWGEKAPACKIRCTTETTAEFGSPEMLSLLELGVPKDETEPAAMPRLIP